MSHNFASQNLRLFYGSFLTDHYLNNYDLMDVFDFNYYKLESTEDYRLVHLLTYYIKNKESCFFDFDKNTGLFSYLPYDKINRVVEEFSINTYSDPITCFSMHELATLFQPFFNNRFRVTAKPIKVLRPILNLPEKNLAILGDLFEKFVQKINADISNVKLISGDTIRWAYNHNNYYKQTGTLGESCMRYDSCQSYFNLYTKNPDKIQLAVYYINGKVAGRCLIWDNKYYDRIYYTDDTVWQTIVRWAEVYGLTSVYRTGNEIEIQIDKTRFTQYPYMDTFKFLKSNGKLSTKYGSKRLFNTDGTYTQCFKCKKCKRYQPIVKNIGHELLGFNGIKLKTRRINICDSCYISGSYVMDAIYGYSIKATSAVWSPVYEGWILKDSATDTLTYTCHNCNTSLQKYRGLTCQNCGLERTA